MRRASTLAAAASSVALSRALLPSTNEFSSAAGFQYRLVQASFYGTRSATSSARSRWFSGSSSEASARLMSLGIAGVVSVAGAGFLLEEAYAKEPVAVDRLPNDVVLYQYEACPFCNKVKAFLDYHDVPYKIVEVNPLSKKEIKWSEYKKVPILMVDGEQLNDSSAIIDKLDDKFDLKKSTKTVTDDDEEKKWRQWVDNHLVHMLSPNIYRNTSEALESFNYITSNGNFGITEKYTVKYAGAAAMYFVSKKLKKKYNITDERKSLYEAAETWVNALDGREFLGGSKPNMADLAVFGVLRPIRYLTAGKDMVEHTRIGEWYARMEREVGESSRINA